MGRGALRRLNLSFPLSRRLGQPGMSRNNGTIRPCFHGTSDVRSQPSWEILRSKGRPPVPRSLSGTNTAVDRTAVSNPVNDDSPDCPPDNTGHIRGPGVPANALQRIQRSFDLCLRRAGNRGTIPEPRNPGIEDQSSQYLPVFALQDLCRLYSRCPQVAASFADNVANAPVQIPFAYILPSAVL